MSVILQPSHRQRKQQRDHYTSIADMESERVLSIPEEDIPYEQEILKHPGAIEPWLRYVEFQADRPILQQVFVFERACRLFGRSYKLWKAYLDLRVNHLKGFNSSKYSQEYDKVNECFERALVLLNKMPRIWIDYLEFLLQQTYVTKTRLTFDKALQSLPVSQHHRIWPLYLKFTEQVNDKTAVRIWKRYVMFRPQDIDQYVSRLIEKEFYSLACTTLIKLLDDPKYVSSTGKSRYQSWTDLADVLVQHPYETKMFSTEKIIRSGIERYPDQAGKLWVNLATYWINKNDIERTRDIFEEGLSAVKTVKDFTLIFDSYTEMEETTISKLMEKEDSSVEIEVDRLMGAFEQLMDRRPFLLSDVLLRQDPNNIVEWEKRAGLWGDNMTEVTNTYTKALATINPSKANGKLYKLWVNYAKFYEKHNDLETARVIFNKASKVPFRSVNELAELYIEWAEMELRADDFEKSLKVLEVATTGPKKSRIDFFDESLAPQERVHKSMKVWSFYVDLIESVGEVEDVKAAYNRIFELKIGTPLTIVNYAAFLWDHQFFEDALKVYERGVEIFSYPVAFEIWNIYLQKAVSRQLGLERLRDLFEQALQDCPPNLSKAIFIQFGKLEEDRGLMSNAMKIYDRASRIVADKDKLIMYKYVIERTIEVFGLAATRPIFERAINALPENEAKEMCLEFINVEEKLGEIDRARTLFSYGSQFADPRVSTDYWEKWDAFEIKYGNEDTYKEMLRIKRSVQAQFNTDVGYIASQAVLLKAKEASERQAAQNSVGFVKSTTSLKPKSDEDKNNDTTAAPEESAASNPDAIDLDMDM